MASGAKPSVERRSLVRYDALIRGEWAAAAAADEANFGRLRSGFFTAINMRGGDELISAANISAGREAGQMSRPFKSYSLMGNADAASSA